MSLKVLKTDVIDLWQLHRMDPKVSIGESLSVIANLQKEGRIRHVGLSEVTPAETGRARKVIEIVSVQNGYKAGDRAHEDVLEYCRISVFQFPIHNSIHKTDAVTRLRWS